MASRDLPAEVIHLLADERGLSVEKICLSDRLLQDLGMDGDDAVEFFDAVHQRFGTDLTHLHEQWSNHFGPEGVSCWNLIVVLPAAAMGGLFAGVTGLSAFWGLLFTGVLLAAWLWAMRRWGPPDRMVPITVAEVIAAVEAGEWPKPFES